MKKEFVFDNNTASQLTGFLANQETVKGLKINIQDTTDILFIEDFEIDVNKTIDEHKENDGSVFFEELRNVTLHVKGEMLTVQGTPVLYGTLSDNDDEGCIYPSYYAAMAL